MGLLGETCNVPDLESGFNMSYEYIDPNMDCGLSGKFLSSFKIWMP